MIPQTDQSLHCRDWQWQLQHSIRTPEALAEALDLTLDNLREVHGAHADFPIQVPLPYLSRMARGQLDDPLLAQVLATPQELAVKPGYSTDPVGDLEANILPGVLHKYAGRVLLMVSTYCAINCRYCFRRHFPYEANRSNKADWQQALEYITATPGISEVIYSGGDPLAMNDDRLAWLTDQVAAIPHIKRLRIHTRLPVVIPQRVTRSLLDWLGKTRLQTVMVMHINHPNEIDDEVAEACRKLSETNTLLLNQSVLLKGVNDQSEVLTTLSEKLFDSGILPYYLHLLDSIQGAAHFNVDESRASELLHQIRRELPGYLVPTLVREIAGLAYKQPYL